MEAKEDKGWVGPARSLEVVKERDEEGEERACEMYVLQMICTTPCYGAH